MRQRRELALSVVDARQIGEGAHMLATHDDVPGPLTLPLINEALAVLWQQERALRIEVAKLQEKLGIRPDKRQPLKKWTDDEVSQAFRDGYSSGELAGIHEGAAREKQRIMEALGVMEVIEDALHAHTHSYHDEDE